MTIAMQDNVNQRTPIQVVSVTPTCLWKEIGTITAVTSEPAAGAMTVALVDALANAVTFQFPAEATTALLRFQSTNNNDAQVVVIRCAPGTHGLDKYNVMRAESYAYGCLLTLTGGTMVGHHSNFFIASLAATNKALTATALDHAANRIAMASIPLLGMKRLAFYNTTHVTSSTMYIEARWY